MKIVEDIWSCLTNVRKLVAPVSQARIIALSTYRAYAAQLLPKRLEQLDKLRGLLAA